ncbi:MAG TPA: PilZ domain-containing protein [Chitinolyticbacter sp.]|uniref:PilZ domain-containing protein n=1 Tax=Chitinolyticbacter albus TaxID=2961951 RepID=UPI00210C1528|nr:PilZ domain-containing protein [Chitinolyticbacter albus]HSC78912.1 PilZ domain-containing protein [Chitinolyticbacter sp.]
MPLPKHEQRAALRIPVDCKVKIRTRDHGPSHYGICTDLSVTGMTIRTLFVPRPDEEFEVYVMPPAGQSPLSARVRVRRCHEIERDKLYELGLAIVEILG